jgi:2'-5' RNA ligase
MGKEDSSTTWRVFCAIDLPESARESIAQHASALRNAVPEARARWSRPENIHLTIKFLGELTRAEVESFSRAAACAVEGFAPFRIYVGQTGVFPSQGVPRVLWIGIQDPGGKLAELHSRLENEASQAGFEKETRSFHPHLTVARLRGRDRRTKNDEAQQARILAAAHREIPFAPLEITASELLVIRSELGSGGSKYSVISRPPLAVSDKL